MPVASGNAVVPPWDAEAFSAAPGNTRTRTILDDAGNTRQQTVMWLFNDLGAAAVLGKPYVIRFNANSAQNPSIAAAAASPSDTPELIAVAINATADQTWDWFFVEGYGEALVDGTQDVTKGDYLSVDDDIVSGGGFKEDTTTRTKNSFGIYQDPTDETTAGVTLRLIYLFGQEAEILT
jgi:hypothetical protein